MKKIAVVGCTGAVGKTMLELLSTTNHYEILCMASDRSAKSIIECNGLQFIVAPFSLQVCATCDAVFLCVSGEFSKEYATSLAKNSIVIDNSSAYRYEDEVPLLVPPINANIYQGERLIANPNCSSAISLMVLGPLHKAFQLESVIASTYQAASGAGYAAMNELDQKIKAFRSYGIDNNSRTFPHNLAFNVIPQIDNFEDNLYTKEEMKIVWEIRKVLRLPNLPVSSTAVRVPTLRSHAIALSIKFTKSIPSIELVKNLLANSEGVKVVDDPQRSIYPMPMTSTYQQDVEVGRIRRNLIYGDYGLDLFVCGDQLLRGAASNAFEILKLTLG